MKSYYCKVCKKTVSFKKDDVMKCLDCSSIFGNTEKSGLQINMRNTWSGTTKVEFNTTTMDESINEMNNR